MKSKEKLRFKSEDLIEDLQALKKLFQDRKMSIVKAYAVVSIMKESINSLLKVENELIVKEK